MLHDEKIRNIQGWFFFFFYSLKKKKKEMSCSGCLFYVVRFFVKREMLNTSLCFTDHGRNVIKCYTSYDCIYLFIFCILLILQASFIRVFTVDLLLQHLQSGCNKVHVLIKVLF